MNGPLASIYRQDHSQEPCSLLQRLGVLCSIKSTSSQTRQYEDNWVCNFTGLIQFYSFIASPTIFGEKFKVPFFRKQDSFFKSPNLPKKLFKKTILTLKFEILAHISKQLIQISSSGQFFWNNFFGRLGDLKNESHFLKKRHLQTSK